jgi:hypothetical protein
MSSSYSAESGDSTPLPLSRLNEEDLESFDSVSREAVEKWRNLKHEMGFECLAIDRALLARKRSVRTINENLKATSALLNAKEAGTMTPRLAREWASQVKEAAEAQVETPGEDEDDVDEYPHTHAHVHGSKGKMGATRPTSSRRSPRRQFYDTYKSIFYPEADSTPEEEVVPKRNWSIMLTGVGVWALVMITGKR